MSKSKLLNFIERNEINVPYNHHDYSSNKGHNKRVLKKLIEKGNLELESIILYEDNGKFSLIDGVNRFTTIYLLLCAVCSKYYEYGELSKYEDVLNNYLMDNKNNKSLILKKRNDAILSDIVEEISSNGRYDNNFDSDNYSNNSIVETYNHFCSLLDDRKSSPKTNHYNYNSVFNNLLKADCNIQYVSKDERYVTFLDNHESLINHKLSHVLIFNYFLENLNKKDKDDFLEKWYKMNEMQDQYNSIYKPTNHFFDHFLKMYLTIKLDHVIEYKEIYDYFLEFVEVKNLKEIYEDIYKYSTYYSNIYFCSEKDLKLKQCFHNIDKCCFSNRLDNQKDNKNRVLYSNEEMRVFLLKVYDDYSNHIITRNEMIFITECIESYVVRRDICDKECDLNITFINLYNNIEKRNYIKSFRNLIINLKKDEEFPTDDKIKGELLIHDFFKENDVKHYVFERLENSLRKSPLDLENYEIEHIMPQTLRDEWYVELGEKAEDIHNEYVNTIGNLTLLPQSANRSLSNMSFNEKINRINVGYKYSDIRLSDDVIKCETWNETTIKKRSTKLAEKIIEIWNYPINDNNFEYKVEDTTIEEFDFNNSSITKELNYQIMSLDKKISRINTNDYTAYTYGDVIILILHEKEDYIECRINMDNEKISQPKNIMGKYYENENNITCYLHDKSDINYTLFLIQQAIDNIKENKTTKNNIINNFNYTYKHYDFGNNTPLFNELQEKILDIDYDITQNNNKYYIAFKLGNRNLINIYPNKEYLDLKIKIPPKYLDYKTLTNLEYNDYDNKTIEIYFEKSQDTDSIINIIKKAYEFIKTGQKPEIKEKQENSLDQYGMTKNSYTRKLFDELSYYLEDYDDIKQINNINCITLQKNNQNFINIFNDTDYLTLEINVKPEEIPEKLKINGKYDDEEIFICYIDEIDDILHTMKIIETAYELF